MSCSVKISCGKSWSGSQRRINSLAEETTCPTVVGSTSCAGLAGQPTASIAAKKGEDTTKLLKYIDDNVIGKNGTFFGPFGRRKGQ
ncbi:hypothetical protein WN51_13754 [Melipona quadrifasciata]|uniref:Uncharacterized protein n=1 Tax=Melipona quadrifasciata TaxID=166423 RepID=A0A0M9A075_9HYME|nr:hypothetical protein WN51_13754 [Melipona quadrifasciata]